MITPINIINTYYDKNKKMFIDTHRKGSELSACLNDYFDIKNSLPKKFVECLLTNRFKSQSNLIKPDIYIKRILFDGMLTPDDWDYSKVYIIRIGGRYYKVSANFYNRAWTKDSGETRYELLGLHELEYVKRVKRVIQKSIEYVEI